MQVKSICKINREEVFQLEGIYQWYLVQLPEQYRDDQKLKSVIRGIIQVSFEHFQAGGINQEAYSNVWPLSW